MGPRAQAEAARPDPLAQEVAAQAHLGGIHADAERPFLPPAPMAAPETPMVAPPARRPDPMAEAELLNAGRAPAPKRSLFARVTGAGRAKALFGQDGTPAPAPRPSVEPSFSAPAAAEPAAPVAPVAPVAPQAQAPVAPPAPPVAQAPARPEPAPQPQAARSEPVKAPPAPPAPPAPSQPALGGLEGSASRDRDLQEDLLEIPAFLRRQAN
jgi:cell division protein FtsZ